MQTELTPQQKRQKILWEARDLLLGAAFPFIIMCIFSSTIIMFADMNDLAVRLIAVIGGDILLAAAYVIFGRQNGATGYRKYYLNETKRALNSAESKVIYKTGEYALWKGFVIPLISCIPFIIFQVIDICYTNTFCQFMLRYACGWAYYPLHGLGVHEAVNFVLIVIPVAAHAAGYVLGMKREEKIQSAIAEESEKKKNVKKGGR